MHEFLNYLMQKNDDIVKDVLRDIENFQHVIMPYQNVF